MCLRSSPWATAMTLALPHSWHCHPPLRRLCSPCLCMIVVSDLNQDLANPPWKGLWARTQTFDEIIHRQGFKAVACEIQRRGQYERDKRIICAIGSRVVVGALGKGRSSSRWPNRWLRRLLALKAATGLSVTPLRLHDRHRSRNIVNAMYKALRRALVGRPTCVGLTIDDGVS